MINSVLMSDVCMDASIAVCPGHATLRVHARARACSHLVFGSCLQAGEEDSG